jgi:hypothetical protein
LNHYTLAFTMPHPDNAYGLIAFLGVLVLFGFLAWLFLK